VPEVPEEIVVEAPEAATGAGELPAERAEERRAGEGVVPDDIGEVGVADRPQLAPQERVDRIGQAGDRRRGDPERGLPPAGAANEEREVDRRHDERGLLGEERDPKGDAGADRRGAARWPQDERQGGEQPEHHEVVEQDHALEEHAQRREREEKRRHSGGDRTGAEATGHPEQQERAAEVQEEHEHPAAVDRRAEGRRATGPEVPERQLQPATGRVVVGVGVGGQALAVQDGERLADVDPFVVGQTERRVAAHVQAMGECRDGERSNEEQ